MCCSCPHCLLYSYDCQQNVQKWMQHFQTGFGFLFVLAIAKFVTREPKRKGCFFLLPQVWLDMQFFERGFELRRFDLCLVSAIGFHSTVGSRWCGSSRLQPQCPTEAFLCGRTRFLTRALRYEPVWKGSWKVSDSLLWWFIVMLPSVTWTAVCAPQP